MEDINREEGAPESHMSVALRVGPELDAANARIEKLEARLKEADKLSVHLQHCNFGEHAGACKYGDEDCPALTETWEWLGWNLQQIKRCDDCDAMMNPIGKGIFECWKCADEAQRTVSHKLLSRAEQAEERIKTLEAANAQWKRYHDAGSAAYERAEKAEADAERLRGVAEELKSSLEYALRATGCDGDLCTEDWHEDARKVLALTESTLSPAEQADNEKGEYCCGYNTVSGAFHKPECTGECGIMNPGEAVERRRIQRRKAKGEKGVKG